MKMLPVRRSKEPLKRICRAMAYNLKHKLRTTVNITIGFWSYAHIEQPEDEFSIWVSNHNEHYRSKTWQGLIDIYYELMKGKLT